MTDTMLWLNGTTVLSTAARAITNELLRAKGVCVIELEPHEIQRVWNNSVGRFRNTEKKTRTGATDRVWTGDLRVTSALLYQLSYGGLFHERKPAVSSHGLSFP